MPFVKITTSQALDAHQREELRQAVWGADSSSFPRNSRKPP